MENKSSDNNSISGSTTSSSSSNNNNTNVSSPQIIARRKSALLNVVQKRNSMSIPVNLNFLIRIFLLDGSSKVLQMFEKSTAKDVLISLKFNLDLQDISTFGLFRVTGNFMRRIELNEIISDVLKDRTESGQEIRILFKSWIIYKYGTYEKEAFQEQSRIKQPNTALWLAYMEASFMCMTTKYYLTEDESILLGCLKMQAESGDFDSSIHTLQLIKIRVITRFPNPIRNKMKALCSPTLIGNINLSDDIAIRIQTICARISGKLKLEAQIDFLNTLRIYCPFYGCTFYDIQCQYDEDPLNKNSSPPVVLMNAGIGPLAIFLITNNNNDTSMNIESPVIIRHPYNRIIKWISHIDKHIFTYWVIKKDITLSYLEELHEKNKNSFDARPYCDCIYLVTPQVSELEYLVSSYVKCRKEIAPYLPNSCIELQNPLIINNETSNTINHNDSTYSDNSNKEQKSKNKSPVPFEKRASAFGAFLQVFSSTNSNEIDDTITNSSPTKKSVSTKITTTVIGSGLIDDEDNSNDIVTYGDDVSAVSTSLFKDLYQSNNHLNNSKDHDSDDDLDNVLPQAVKYASTMSELQKFASETNFSDAEDDHSEENDDDVIDNNHSRNSNNHHHAKHHSSVNKDISYDSNTESEYQSNSNKKLHILHNSSKLYANQSNNNNSDDSDDNTTSNNSKVKSATSSLRKSISNMFSTITTKNNTTNNDEYDSDD